ncbi:hypothetical protein [Thalassomonas sp. RHCl1]|uniref:hypothetical protein n=1 Tax=Thalassomonas sp. RHCl1 TaxID=2995320 RepID=UPI00248C787E|nr:hypothetical protein [Thalassomonas sp. RHCl1]
MLLQQFKDLLENLKGEFKYSDQIAPTLQELKQYQAKTIVAYQPAYMKKALGQMQDVADKEAFKKIVILSCLIENWDDFTPANYSQSVLDQYQIIFNRILGNCENSDGWGEQKLDVYWKELAMARQLMFPAGAQITEHYSGFSAKQGIHLNRLGTLSFLSFLAAHGGSKGYYQIHTYTPELGRFNEQGWNDCYVHLAQMMKINPEIKGFFGISWFYDPQLADISPRLMYLQSIPLQNGAKSFYMGKDETGNAISKSKSRLKLYEEGKYTPQSYLLVWPREALIAWADEYVKTNPSDEHNAVVN